jgi:hypothetical protein
MYGARTTPSDLLDEALIRASGVTFSAEQEADSFMQTGAGQFALGSSFKLVRVTC